MGSAENSVVVKTPKELGQAIKNEQSTIVIEGDLTQKVIRIKATGKVAWGVAIGAVGIAVYCTLATPAATVASAPVAGAGGAITFTGAAAATATAATVLGISAPIAIAIAVAAGGVGALTSLRDKYKIEKINKNKAILHRK